MSFYKVKLNDQGTFWRLNSMRHRVFGPAIEFKNGSTARYRHGQHHREDGPAVEYADGYKARYLNGFSYGENCPEIE